MNAPLSHSIKLNDPDDIFAAVPHLLGFTPTESLVVITVDNTGTRPRFGSTLRLDLPPEDEYEAIGRYLGSGPLRHQGTEAVLLNVVGFGADRPPPESAGGSEVPQRELVGVVREVLEQAGIVVLHAAWAPEIAPGAPWRCYDDEACGGEISDPKSSPLAAALAAVGAVTFDSREELQQLVAADPPDVLARRTAKLDVLTECRDADGASAVQEDVRLVFDAVRRTAEGTALTEDDHLRVLLALSDHRVRDLALGMALGDSARSAEQLWLTLVRKAPPPEVADVAALLAFSAYLRGEGALASVALERIESVRPEHRLGSLLRRALDSGISPTDLAVVARDAADDARVLIEEGGD